jgi:hypothetical protein
MRVPLGARFAHLLPDFGARQGRRRRMRSRVRHLLFGSHGAGVGQLVRGSSLKHGVLRLGARQGRRGFHLRPVGRHFLGTGFTRVTKRAVGAGGEHLLPDFGRVTGAAC